MLQRSIRGVNGHQCERIEKKVHIFLKGKEIGNEGKKCAQCSGVSRISQTGGQLPGWSANLLFGQFFPKNFMKMKEIGPGGGGGTGARPWRQCQMFFCS